MKVRRFFYVASPRGNTKHVMFGAAHRDGLTACGRIVPKSWLWWVAGRSKLPRCKQCEASSGR